MTSSSIPTVKWFLGWRFLRLSNTALTMAGVNSLEERPNRPPTRRGIFLKGAVPLAIPSTRAWATSRCRGSPPAPGSLVLSRTAMALTVGGEGLDEVVDGEGAVEAHFQHPDLLTLGGEVVHRFVGRLGARAHDDDDALRIGGPDVVEQAVLPADDLGEPVHGLLDEAHAGGVEGVMRFARLEEVVRVLGGAAQDGAVGIETADPVGAHQVVVHQGLEIIFVQLLDLLHFGGGAETVEKVEDGDAGPEGGGVGDTGQVHDLLDAPGSQQGPAGGAAVHDIAVVAEDGEGVGGDRAGGDVEDRGGEFTGDLVHVGDHEEEPLGGSEGGGQRPRLDRPVDGTGRTPLRLHLGDAGNGPPEVLHPFGGPLVRPFAHGGRGGDRVDGNDLAQFVRDVCGGFVAVDRHHFATHTVPP